jgi:cytochrome b6-f complex iron-sulfur subunit
MKSSTDHKRLPSAGGEIQRRSFISILLMGGFIAWIGAILYPIVAYILPPKVTGGDVSSVKAATTDELKPNSAKIFKFGRKPGLLLRLENGEYRAFIAICTHLSCTVQYRKDMGLIWCACHNGKYNLNGINISGPPPRPLTVLDVHVKGDAIFVSTSSS